MSTFIEFSDETFSATYNILKGKCKNACKNFAILKVAFASEEIALLYSKAIEKHNHAFVTNNYCDSGVDLFIPDNSVFDKELEPRFVDMKLKTEMVYCDVSNDAIYPSAYYLYPRSSMSKTPLILANHVGIIDAGYRGSVISAFKWVPPPSSSRPHYVVEEGTRLTQICHPTLCPIYIRVVDAEDLTSTERGSGGFGSTG